MTVTDWIAFVGGFIRENSKCLMSHSSMSRTVIQESIIYYFQNRSFMTFMNQQTVFVIKFSSKNYFEKNIEF